MPSFSLSALQTISEILGDTEYGFSGTKIGRLLSECNISDVSPTLTKRIRLYDALREKQNEYKCGNNIVAFIEHSMDPVRHHSTQEWFQVTQLKLNNVLAFAGYKLCDNGKITKVEKVETHMQVTARASRLREHLVIRKVHPDVLHYCKEELLVDNYFHSVFEATKSVADKIRNLSKLKSDGAELVDEAFTFKSTVPYLAINSFVTESQKSEQKGFMNLLKGLFGTFRNTTAHEPKITWKIEEQDALDILSLVSLVHRRLDSAVRAKEMYEGKI